MGLEAGGWRLVCLHRVGSTNDVARLAGERGIAERLAIFAEEQTAGRGRRGRAWTTPPGRGLLGSTLWRPAVAPARAATLGQVAAVATLDALAIGGLEARLKWPNDVLVDGAKVAGILLESAIESARLRHVVIGIGINVNQAADELPPAPYPATSLRLATGRPTDRAGLAAALLTALARAYDQWQLRPGDVFARWRGALATLDQVVTIVGPDGEQVGRARDVEPDGSLLLERADGSIERLVSGEVSVRA
jgi:BirA family transcriptional regulator, biotin operon repressor / biotin---[acetyl-CoA-carboxylase] ligase